MCREDPRTKRQRRADALAALAAGVDTLACRCDAEECPARDTAVGDVQVVINLVASAESLSDGLCR